MHFCTAHIMYSFMAVYNYLPSTLHKQRALALQVYAIAKIAFITARIIVSVDFISAVQYKL